ncbi:MAG: DUF1573 domain-containing protein [Bacteroidales bacterium]|nr:DUF1573 domain-containing protein [Bacteroidales bacterium]
MKKFVVILSVFVFTSFILCAQTQDSSEKVNGPEISFKKDVHDYGEIPVNSDGSSTFEFTNTGNEPLILSQPRSSCGCTVPTWPRQPILPGEKEKITVTYNTARPGLINKSVTILSNAKKNSSVILRIKGNVVAKPAETLLQKDVDASSAPVNKSM